MKQRLDGQRGITLIMVMIFLVMLTLFSVSIFRASTSNARITQNMAIRQESVAAAQAGIETMISGSAFLAATAASNVPTQTSVDVDGDGVNDYEVSVLSAQRCSKIRQLSNAELPKETVNGVRKTAAAWIRCEAGTGAGAVGGSTGSAGLIEGGTSTGSQVLPSYCVETHWNIQADVTDSRTATTVQVNQGVSVPYSIGEAGDRCGRNN